MPLECLAEAVELAEAIVMVELEAMAEAEEVQMVVKPLVSLALQILEEAGEQQGLLTTEHLVLVDQV